jgi:succinate dehydrogenase hydrophobic anchor subunit
MNLKHKLHDWWDQFECALTLVLLLFVGVALLACAIGFPVMMGYVMVVGTMSEKLFAVFLTVGLFVACKRLSRIKNE